MAMELKRAQEIIAIQADKLLAIEARLKELEEAKDFWIEISLELEKDRDRLRRKLAPLQTEPSPLQAEPSTT